MNPGHYFRPLIPVLTALIPGIFIGAEYPGRLFWAVPGVFLTGAWLIHGLFRHKSASFSPLFLLFLVGYLSIQPWSAPRFDENHVVHLIGPRKHALTGTVDRVLHRDPRGTRFILKDLFIVNDKTHPGGMRRVGGKLRVSCWGKAPLLKAGDALSLTARIRPVRSFKNPGGFDYQRYLAFKGIWALAYASEIRRVEKPKQAPFSFSNRIRSIRQDLSRFIDKELSGRTSAACRGVVKALVLGDRSGIGTGLREAFNRAGVSHILAISGLHIGIVAGGAFGLFSRLLALFRVFLFNAWTRKGAALLSLFPVLVYGVLSGMSPSTQRAMVMVGVFLGAFLFEKAHEPFNTLAAAALGILILDPCALFSISFQLSFASVFWILLGMSRTKAWWGSPGGAESRSPFFRIKKGLLSFFLVSLFAVLGTLPVGMFYFNQISLVSPAANMVIIPLMGFVAVPAGLVAVFLFPVHLPSAAFFLKVSAAVTEYAISGVRFFSEIPFAFMKTITPSLFEIALFYGTLGLFLAWIGPSETVPAPMAGALGEKGLSAPPAPLRSGHFTGYRVKGALLLLLLFWAGDIGYWVHYRLWHKDLRITVMDVGPGNAVLVELPGGYNLLIDGGGFSDNAVFDVGAKVVAPFLWRKKILGLDTIVLSHPNSDHMNGLIYVLRHFRVKSFWSNGERAPSRSFQVLMQAIRERGVAMPPYATLPRSSEVHGAGMRIWYPPPDFEKRKAAEAWRNANNNSMVLRIRYKDYAFLFPGDIMRKAERELLSMAGTAIRSTLLLAPHHGSNTSSTLDFLNAVKPEYVVVSAGRKGPHPEVLKRYQRVGATVFSTHIHGAVRIFVGNNTLRILKTVSGSFRKKPVH